MGVRFLLSLGANKLRLKREVVRNIPFPERQLSRSAFLSL